MNEKIQSISSKKIYTGMLFPLVIFVHAVFSTFCVQYTILSKEDFTRISKGTFALNVLCALGIYLLIHGMTNQIVWTYAICHTLLVVFAFIDYYVYLFRGNEFTFADIRSLGTGLSVAGNYQIELHAHGLIVILSSLLLLLVLAWKCKVKFEGGFRMRSLCVLAGGLCLLFVMSSTRSVSTETWQQKGTYRNGYLLNFALSIRDSFVQKPKGYQEEILKKLEQQYAGEDLSVGAVQHTKPVIIVIMNESFADLRVVGEMNTNIPVMPFFDSLQKNTTKGYALASVFGAKTPNSEWEYLTGHTMAFLPEGSVVYQQYMKEDAPSLLSVLKREGYTCAAMHPYYAAGWSRNQIYPELGFDEMYFLNSFDQSQILRQYITDEELYRKIIERFENRKINEKLFIMSVSMQNHGGYTKSYDNFTEECYKTGKSYTDANQYLSLIHESDKALEYLITYFSQVDEPVEIVFFGDHQPSLNSRFYPLLNGKGLSGLTLSEVENLFTVPFFIWTNYDTGKETVPITSLNFLSAMTLEKAGLPLPPYYRMLTELREAVPAINVRGYYSLKEGDYLHLEEAEGVEADWISKYHILQYNAMFDTKGRSEVFFPKSDQ